MSPSGSAKIFLKRFEGENFDAEQFERNLTCLLERFYNAGYACAEGELEDEGLDEEDQKNLEELKRWQGQVVNQLRRFFDARAGRIQADPDREIDALLEPANAGAFMAKQSSPVLA